MTRPRVAVLGAGAMGSATALHLTRLGASVTVFDRAPAPFCGASRWNEGKIHLGFLYAADPSLETARKVLPGGLAFKDQVESLTACSLDELTTPQDDVYLVHRDSVVAADDVASYFAAVGELVRGHPDAARYLVDVSECSATRLTADELGAVADETTVGAGFRSPERSVDTNRIADAFVDALNAHGSIELEMNREVVGVQPQDERFRVQTADSAFDGFDAVVNALWEGRPAIDRTVGHHPDVAEHHRYRVSLFVRTDAAVATPSAVLSVGAFGDVKCYSPTSFYLSWYPAGLLASGEDIDPPPVPKLADEDRRRIAATVFAELRQVLPWVGEIERNAVDVRVEGGWVYSQGRGLLDDPQAAIHRRHLLGITRLGSYFSVDTGKYSVAPTLAEHLAHAIAGT